MTTAGTETKTLGQKAVDRFTEMMIERMEQMKSVGWHKGWIGGATAPGAMPQNVSGRGYSGSNSFFLQLDTALRGYSMPVYLTFKQANDLGAHVKKGESAMPVLYWDIMARDKDGRKITKDTYRKMSLAERMQVQTIPFLKAYNVFNVDQTNLAEVKPDKVEALKKLFAPPELRDAEGMFTSKALDRMFEKQEWICPIQYDKQVPGAYFSPSKDIIVIPRKEQFNIGKTSEEIYKDGMEYYSTALHEMAHSTGTESRLNRGSHEKFGDAKYAKEELVAELTAAMVGNSMGFDKRILNNNAAYLDGWISTLKENPKKMALGEEPLLDKNRNLSADATKDKIVFENASIIKQNSRDYAVRASFQGRELGVKPIDKSLGMLYFSLSEGTEKNRLLFQTLEKSYGDVVLSQSRKRSHQMKV